jgi:hypothetical protein
MSAENEESFNLENDQTTKTEDHPWINELRIVLERGCDLGSIRNICQCRPLTDDLRLPVWKVRKCDFFLLLMEFVLSFRYVLVSMNPIMNIHILIVIPLIYGNNM